MPARRNWTRRDFLDEYELSQTPPHDFEVDGEPAQYATANPRPWGMENWSINLNDAMTNKDGRSLVMTSSAISSDQKLLAITTTSEGILVYDIISQELRSTLEGAGGLVFRPSYGAVDGYTLISSISDAASRGATRSNRLTFWELDSNGRQIDHEEPVDSSALAHKAIEAIMPTLESEHEWTKEFVNASKLHADVEKALAQAATDHRRRHNTLIEDAKLGAFGSESFSTDGSLFLYHTKNDTTQHGMRASEKLPHVIVYDMKQGKTVTELAGHTDAIMWSAISPDSQHVASISWDGTMRMYSLPTGTLDWVTESTDGQCWSGAFAPDSKHIIWSSGSGKIITVLVVADGTKAATFPEKMSHWCRSLAWHPDGNTVAFTADRHAYVWRPFTGPEGTTVQNYYVDDINDWRAMLEVRSVRWMAAGRLLAVQFSEGSALVYDTEINHKELFLRPKGTQAAWTGDNSFYGVLKDIVDRDVYLSVDGDGKARFWLKCIPAIPSWWEKEKDPAHEEKKPFPETGKYVKVIKVSSKAAGGAEAGEGSQ